MRKIMILWSLQNGPKPGRWELEVNRLTNNRNLGWDPHGGEDFVGDAKFATGVHHNGRNGRVVGVTDVGKEVVHHLQQMRRPQLQSLA